MSYVLATIRQIDPPDAQERVRLVVEFTGNAGEPPKPRERYVTGDDTGQTLKDWARAEAVRLSGRKSIADSLTVGQAFDMTPPAGPTQADLDRRAWLVNVRRLENALRLVAAGSLPSTDAGITTLRTTVTNGFPAGAAARAAYLDEL